MGRNDFVLTCVKSCVSGALTQSDCGPVWQLAVIGALLLIAVVALAVLRLRSAAPTFTPTPGS